MKPNVYRIIQDCIENGIDYGYMRAHKHDEHPSEQIIKEQIFGAIMNEICEYFKFSEEE